MQSQKNLLLRNVHHSIVFFIRLLEVNKMELLSEKDALNWILYVLYFGFPILIAINLGVLITLIQLKSRNKR